MTSTLAAQILDGAKPKSSEGRKVTATFTGDVIDIVEKYRGGRSFKDTAAMLILFADEELEKQPSGREAAADDDPAAD